MARSRVALVVAAALVGCGGMHDGGAPPSAAFVISAAGLSPQSVEVMSDACLVFQNTDAVAHQVQADDAFMCSELNEAQALAPGATWTACVSMGPKTCSFHDASPSAAAGTPAAGFAGTIRVDASMDMMPSM